MHSQWQKLVRLRVIRMAGMARHLIIISAKLARLHFIIEYMVIRGEERLGFTGRIMSLQFLRVAVKLGGISIFGHKVLHRQEI